MAGASHNFTVTPPSIIVMDASGSIWSQIDSVHKISIAQQVVSDVLPATQTSGNLGLGAYSHSRKGDCSVGPPKLPPAA